MPVDAAATEKMVGAHVSVKITGGEEAEGVIFTFDSTTGTLILQQAAADSKATSATYRVIKTGCIRELTVLTEAPRLDEEASKPPLPVVSVEMVRSREERAVQKAREDAKGVNPKVTTRDQTIFHSLNKTMPCEWLEQGPTQAILVLGEILILPPYTVDTCKGEATPTLARVQKVLGGVLQKLG